jgi:hypothetical protein
VGNAAKVAGREIAKAAVDRTVAAKVAEANGAIAVTTGGVATAAASKGRRKSISKN